MRKICCFILFFVLNALIQAGATIIAVEKPAEFNLSKTEETILFELTHPGDRMLALAVEFVGNAGKCITFYNCISKWSRSRGG